MACSPAASVRSSAWSSAAVRKPPAPGLWCRRSMISTGGNAARVARSGKVSSAGGVPSSACRGVGLHRWRGRAEHDDGIRCTRTTHRRVAAVVAHAVFLLERGIVLFVDDHHAEARLRREHRRARAERDRGFAALEPTPRDLPLAIGERAVQHRDRRAEAGLEARGELWRERDLGHEHERALAARDRRGDDAQVHLGLAGAGHAVQQEGRVAAAVERRTQRVDGDRLRGGERRAACSSSGGIAIVGTGAHAIGGR